jgi:hypothetical protein
MKTYKPGNRPRCLAFVSRTMGTMDTCKKYADWRITGASLYTNAMPVCRDCVAKVLTNLGDKIDGISFDIIIVTK